MAAAGMAALALAALTTTGFSPAVEPSEQNPVRPADLWFVPAVAEADGAPSLAEVASLIANGKPADALQSLATASFPPELAGYALLYEGRALCALDRWEDARGAARRLLGREPGGYLLEASWALLADAAERAEHWAEALQALERLAGFDGTSRRDVLLRIGRAAQKAGSRAKAEAAYARVYFEHPAAGQAAEARKGLDALGVPVAPTSATWERSLDRAEHLFAGGRWADARLAFGAVRGFVSGSVRDRVDLRLAQTDHHLRRHEAAADALRAIAAATPDPDIAREAEYVSLGAVRALGRTADYLRLVDRFVRAHAGHPLAETALNDLGTHYILANDDGTAAEVFRDMYRRDATGAFAGRAAWKAGWWSYRAGDYAETIRLFESASVGLRRADFRPAWLYWAARSHEHLGRPEAAIAGYRQTIHDYRNSYYGREARRRLEPLLPAAARPAAPASDKLPPTLVPGPSPGNAALVEQLLAAGLYDDAVRELRAAQRASGSSPRLEATLAYALNRLGQLRPAITTMRRAYPQFMASGGEALPREILTVIFPVDYWDLIRRYSAAHKLDPFLMTALVAQESTFQADVRSPANAWGLMQIIPGTGQRYARVLGIRPFTTRRLVEPETNVRIGMRYFADLLRQFGDPAPALAAYNAGEHRVVRWLADRPGLARDEFVDDIPFPETQNYVKRVLGTAEDYRLLYGDRTAAALNEP